jgi:uncharacterized repeat protein (TIGR03847 family)
MPVYDFDHPARFVAGTVGPPGMRTFFLQARDERRLISVSCEKEQLAAVAERLVELLDELSGGPGGPGGAASEASAASYADDGPLETPIEDEFRVTTMSLGWDDERGVVLIEATHETDDPPDDADEPTEQTDATAAESLRVTLSPAQARAFARRTQALVSAGRPPCPFCGGPLDPTGHVCPRANGYRR